MFPSCSKDQQPSLGTHYYWLTSLNLIVGLVLVTFGLNSCTLSKE